jgi:3-phytase
MLYKMLVTGLLLSLCQLSNSWATPPALPAPVAKAAEIAALADGQWLVAGDDGLALLDAGGRERARLAFRVEYLDTRPLPQGVLVAILDANTQETLILTAHASSGELQVRHRIPSPALALEGLCLYRDAQRHDHLFLLGKDGHAEQWLLSGSVPRLLRRLALPPGSEHCRGDDARQRLLVSEANFGLWAYDAAGEGVPERHLLAATKPWGSLSGGAGPIAVLPSGLALLNGKGTRLGLWQADVAAAPIKVSDGEGLALWGSTLLLRDGDGWRPLPVKLPAARTAAASQLPVLQASAQTDGMASWGDAADDPAIWIHPRDAARSLVLGTNKKQGLLVYDLQGRQQQLLEAGRLNNVDVRQRVRLGGRSVDLAVATQRDEKALALFEIDPDGWLRDVGRVATELQDIYGTCLYQPPEGGLEVIANDKDGRFVQYRLELRDGVYGAQPVRRFQLASQPEGCVADDQQGRLFIGEEDVGIWSLSARAEAAASPTQVMAVGPRLVADVEGLALYHGEKASYLVASSQGNNSFVVLDAQPPHAYRGAFRIGLNPEAGIDGVSETDGLEATAINLGGPFAEGMLVVQDGYKRLPDGTQNFKYLPWRDVARALGLQ